ncbi:toll/interleukin-1 receptor domain-containing protein [Bacillus sp. AG4(2022)]|uniref:toll/interleukin-1 receptor domain-containing protein n=1 Tax=Bacillus sp. AG4(2022) TaxID=2962594 RepID=UPI002880EE3E|nr:toll/interleukin-1 receptor domain-containing protein [Bacillus sp. AG4(2022)]MDT0160655.1 toll/interleukin-1 receptor domain-containing protein [Bacillus sp. AG4(2022)]
MSEIENQNSVPDTIFISHASKDREYVKELVNLLTPLKVPNIVCSSLNGYHIPNDKDIYKYLAQNLNRNGRVIFVLSKNYYDSAACLNEMGACWILNKSYTTILTPNFEYEEIAGAVNPNQMSFKLNDEDRLCEFIESIKSEFNTTGLPTMQLAELVKLTIQNVNIIAYDEKVKMEKATSNIESIRNRDGKLEVALRVINPTLDRIKIDSIIFDFKDDQQYTLKVEQRDLDLLLYKNENRIFHFELNYEDSNFNFYRSVSQDVELRTYIDAW